jgi:micrococcal nuclease
MAKTIVFSIREVVKVYDGDSMLVMLDHGRRIYSEVKVRLNGLDTPETRGDEKPWGLKVKEVAQDWIATRKDTLIVVSYMWEEKYGRLMVDFRDKFTGSKQSLCEFLLANKLARPYAGEKRKPWTAEQLAAVDAWKTK